MSHPSPTADDPRDQAAAWFARLHSGDATAQDRREFAQWRAAHPEHDRQYRNVEQIWQATLRVPEHELREILNRGERPAAAPNALRRRLGWTLAGVSAAALLGGVGLSGGWFASPRQTIAISTPRGQRRQMTLPDGTELDVNTDTQARFRLYDGERVIELQQGEIFFSVAHDAERPFIVKAGGSRIVVTGTRFNVRHDAEQTRVSVESGSVQVSSGPWWQRQSRSLGKDQGVDISETAGLGDIQPRDLNSLLAWQRNKIVFENMPLAEAVVEINRYLAQPALLDAPALRSYRIAGIFSVEDPQALLDTLPAIAPVRVERLADGRARIVAR